MTWTLAITETQFAEIYGARISPKLFKTLPADDNEYIETYLPSKLWRLNNLYTIVDKDGNRVRFNMNYAQHIVYAASLHHARLIILKSRQQGISTFWLISFLDDAILVPDLTVGLMAQGNNEAGTLLKRVKLAWQEFSDELRSALSQSIIRDNATEIGFANGATLFIRTSFRSATLQRLHISEYGKIANNNPERAKETKTGTLQAIRPGNTVVIESTAEGDNEFKRMWDNAITAEEKVQRLGLPCFAGKDFKPVFLSWVYDPDCVEQHFEEPSLTQAAYFREVESHTGVTLSREQINFWLVQYRELGDAIYQEYPATPEEAFTKTNDGSYYGVAFRAHVVAAGRVVSDLYDPNLDVFVAMDLGINDMFTMVYFQRWENEWRIIDEYSNTGEGLEFYVNQMRSTPYTIAKVICPHDIRVRDLSTGKTRLARLRELGVGNVKVLDKLGIADGIEQVRKVLPQLWVDEKCVYSISCFKQYSKEWDDRLGVWKAKPLHDKFSHGADAIRYMAVSKMRHRGVESREQSGVVNGLAL